MNKINASEEVKQYSSSDEPDANTNNTTDWRGDMLNQVRNLIKVADPEVVEEVKWVKPSNPAGVPTWYHSGIICTGETYKDKVKFTFAKGASLQDPTGLFNSSLEGNVRRAVDYFKGDQVDEEAFVELIRAAVAFNTSSSKKKG